MGAQRCNIWLAHAAVKPVLWAVCLLPLAGWAWRLASDGLGPNPVEYLLRASGDWALRGVCVVLLLTPLQQGLGWTALGRMRRMLGLFCFFYAAVHAGIYGWLEMGWLWREIWQDLGQRPFMAAGMGAWLVLAALAATSSQKAIRALGGRRWKRLHQSVHAAAWLALLHFYWMREGKNTTQDVMLYAGVIAALQAWRLWRRWR